MAIAALPKNLRREVKATVLDAIADVLGDPDLGLELSFKAKRRLKGASKSKKTVPFAEIKRKYY